MIIDPPPTFFFPLTIEDKALLLGKLRPILKEHLAELTLLSFPSGLSITCVFYIFVIVPQFLYILLQFLVFFSWCFSF